MTAVKTIARRTCAGGCGTYLSRYNVDSDGLCAACRSSEDARPDPEVSPETLERLIAGILLVNDALRPGEPVNLSLELAAYGIAADSWTVGLAVRHLGTRHGIIASGERGRPGYVVTEWERRYRPMRGFGGVEIRRDAETGRLLPSLLPQPGGPPEVRPGQLSILGSDIPTAENGPWPAATATGRFRLHGPASLGWP